MMKSKTAGFLFVLLFLWLAEPFFLQGKEVKTSKKSAVQQKEQKKAESEKKPLTQQGSKEEPVVEETVLSAEEQRALIEQQVLEKLEAFKYAASASDRQQALDFLFDHMAEARSFLYDELIIEENEDLILANVLMLLSYDSEPLNLSRLLDSLEIQKKKTRYLEDALSYLFQQDPENTVKILKIYFFSGDFNRKKISLEIMEKNSGPAFRSFLLENFNKEPEPYFQEKILQTLLKYDLSEKETRIFFISLQSPFLGVRNAGVQLLTKFPDFFNEVRLRLEDSENLFEKQSLLFLLAQWSPDAKKMNLALEAAKNPELLDSVLECFLFWGRYQPGDISSLTEFYDQEPDFRLVALAASRMLYSGAEEPLQKQLLQWYQRFFSQNPGEALRYEVYKILARFPRNLPSDFILDLKTRQFRKESFRNRKLIRQILDLSLEN